MKKKDTLTWTEYSIVVVNFDDTEERIDVSFESLKKAQDCAKNIDKNHCSGYRIMKMEYHCDNGQKIYDDEIVVDSVDFEEENNMLYQLQRQRTAGAYIGIQIFKTHEEAVQHLAKIAAQENPNRPYNGEDKWQNSSNVHNVDRYRIIPLNVLA